MFRLNSSSRSRYLLFQRTGAVLLLCNLHVQLLLIGTGCLLTSVSSTVLPRSDPPYSFVTDRLKRPSEQQSASKAFSSLDLHGYFTHHRQYFKQGWVTHPVAESKRLLGQGLSHMRRLLVWCMRKTCCPIGEFYGYIRMIHHNSPPFRRSTPTSGMRCARPAEPAPS